MHHFIYPVQDTYITNRLGYQSSNFGLDEMLRVDTTNVTSKYYAPTLDFNYSTQSVSNWCVAYFTGLIATGSLIGSSIFTSGSTVVTSGTTLFTASYFNGTLTGSYNGWITGSSISSSNFTGSLVGFSGSVSATGWINGFISGSLAAATITRFDGYLYGFTGKIVSGIVTGTSTVSQSHVVTQTIQTIDRSLIKFDITEISKSIASGDIVSPEFTLNLKVAREGEIPLQYNIYAMPISQSWSMGTGYWSDNGSTDGASWYYRDNSSGNVWYPVTDPNGTSVIDFIARPNSATGSWARGGATWYLGYIVSQSFGYEIGDISMNVTPIVNAWISGTIPNEGFILINSSEQTLDNNTMYFFSQDTNTIYSPRLDVGWSDFSFTTGTTFTSSVNITTIPAGLDGIVSSGASISGSIYGGFTGFGDLTVDAVGTASGVISATGTSGLILSMSIYGNISGSVSSSIVTVCTTCGTCTPTFTTSLPCDGASTCSMVTMSILMGTLQDGNFSGSTITASYNGYKLDNGILSGSWNTSFIVGSTITSDYPFMTFYPSAMYVVFSGSYVNGTAFGDIINLSASYAVVNYGIFDGVFVDGDLAGYKVIAPFTGSILSASYSYTSSIETTTTSLEPVTFNIPFVTVIQNLPPTVRAGNIIRVNIFARPEFPLKNFNRKPQFSQFLTPQYLPTSSYYAIKDNETEQIIVDFDNYTKISCDVSGSHFFLDTSGLPQERYFKILIKTEQNNLIYTFDRNDIFKIVR
jgi:hypothetical protein